MAVAIYLAAHSVIWPLVKDQDWYSGRWTDPTYSFSLAFQPTAQLESLSQSIALSLNLWNSVAGVNLGFITCVTILLAAGHRTLRARFETETLRHIAFAAGWTGVVFLLSLAPLLITAKPIPGYRVLFVPMTVVWVTLFWSIIYLDRIFASAARLDFTLVVIAAAVCAYTLVMLGSVVAYERKAISCTERIFLTQDLSRTRLIFFKRGAADVAKPFIRFKHEYGWNFAHVGPRNQMGINVIKHLTQTGKAPKGLYLGGFGDENQALDLTSWRMPDDFTVASFIPGQCAVYSKMGIVPIETE